MPSTAFIRASFAVNLRWLCGKQPSIASVCRRTNINRQQFNRYLAGTSVPSAEVMRRICGLLGVPEAAMFLPHPDLIRLVEGDGTGQALAQCLTRAGARRPELKLGFYLRLEKGSPDHSLLWLHPDGQAICFRAAVHRANGLERRRGMVAEMNRSLVFFAAGRDGEPGLSIAVYGTGEAVGKGAVPGLEHELLHGRLEARQVTLEYLGNCWRIARARLAKLKAA